jgi:hypothetical protein
MTFGFCKSWGETKMHLQSQRILMILGFTSLLIMRVKCRLSELLARLLETAE